MSTIVFLFMHRINDGRLVSIEPAEITGGKEILLLSIRWTMQGYNLIDEKFALVLSRSLNDVRGKGLC